MTRMERVVLVCGSVAGHSDRWTVLGAWMLYPLSQLFQEDFADVTWLIHN